MRRIFTLALVLVSPLLFAQKNDSVRIEIKNLGTEINSKFPDYAPVITADASQLFYTSRRPVSEKEIKKGTLSNENVYVSYFNTESKSYISATILPKPVNQPGRHNSIIGISADGQKMLLYQDDVSGNGDIYESKLMGNAWSTPEKLPSPVNSEHHESSACYSPDGKTIYFVSNRPGGYGQRDIWMSRQQSNGKWTDAVNLGNTINTSKNEEGVFMHPDGVTFYFSSEGHNTLGKLDIYFAKRSGDRWNSPVNMGSPVNTPNDDVYFVMHANGKTAYFSSFTKENEKEIFEVNFIPLEKEKEKEMKGPKLTLLKGTVTDEATKLPLGSTIEIIDNSTGEIYSTITSNSSTGKYLISLPSGKNYGLTVSAKGYLFHSENFNIPDTAAYQEITKDVELKKLEAGKTITLNNIFYDFDKATLRSESVSELNRLVALMNENPTLKIELGSHTDNKGTNEYNHSLSQRRAQAVVDYLIGKNISKDRLVAKGYGEEKPVATNDTEEGRQLNRRTEFKVLSK
ncbi:MAG: OmpA family protein [Bacteroidota bacterium]